MHPLTLPARARSWIASFVAGAVICVSAAPAQASPFAVSTVGSTVGTNPEGEALHGDDDPAVIEAKQAYQLGSDAYALGNYQTAVGHFERAYELTHQPELLFNLGQSYTRWYDISNDLEHLKKARRLYENYVLNVGALGHLDEEQQAQARADAQRRITEVDRRIAQHDDGGSTTTTPTDKPAKPVHKKAWFWVTIIGGLAVVGGVTAAVVLTTRKPGFEPELGTLGAVGAGGGQLSAGSGGLTLRF
jgi:hypothetical protein